MPLSRSVCMSFALSLCHSLSISYLPTCLSAYPSTCLSTCLPSRLPACLPAYLSACLPVSHYLWSFTLSSCSIQRCLSIIRLPVTFVSLSLCLLQSVCLCQFQYSVFLFVSPSFISTSVFCPCVYLSVNQCLDLSVFESCLCVLSCCQSLPLDL